MVNVSELLCSRTCLPSSSICYQVCGLLPHIMRFLEGIYMTCNQRSFGLSRNRNGTSPCQRSGTITTAVAAAIPSPYSPYFPVWVFAYFSGQTSSDTKSHGPRPLSISSWINYPVIDEQSLILYVLPEEYGTTSVINLTFADRQKMR